MHSCSQKKCFVYIWNIINEIFMVLIKVNCRRIYLIILGVKLLLLQIQLIQQQQQKSSSSLVVVVKKNNRRKKFCIKNIERYQKRKIFVHDGCEFNYYTSITRWWTIKCIYQR